MTYDKIDARIIAALRENSCGRLHELCGATRIAKSTLHERLRKLVDGGVRCVPIIDWQKLGYPLNVIFITPCQKELADEPCVNLCQHVSPNLLLLECVFRNMEEFESFKSKLKYARFFPVVQVLKREGVFVDG
jgi:DNA-binding Lrp family transcriptional regulator